MRTAHMISKAAACILTIALAMTAAAVTAQRADVPAPSGVPVTVTKVVARSLDRPLLLPGDLIAFQDVEIRAKVAGFVDAVNVDRGSMVRRGELLVRIVAPELVAQRTEADARIQS